jgi:hypothetical protein
VAVPDGLASNGVPVPAELPPWKSLNSCRGLALNSASKL